jgi:pre-mRNA-splicing factor ATP-dependent RNA helicase DHX15/PRP43
MTDRKRKLDLGDADPSVKRGASEGGGAGGEDGLNPYTGRPYSPRYYEILEKRKGE